MVLSLSRMCMTSVVAVLLLLLVLLLVFLAGGGGIVDGSCCSCQCVGVVGSLSLSHPMAFLVHCPAGRGAAGGGNIRLCRVSGQPFVLTARTSVENRPQLHTAEQASWHTGDTLVRTHLFGPPDPGARHPFLAAGPPPLAQDGTDFLAVTHVSSTHVSSMTRLRRPRSADHSSQDVRSPRSLSNRRRRNCGRIIIVVIVVGAHKSPSPSGSSSPSSSSRSLLRVANKTAVSSCNGNP